MWLVIGCRTKVLIPGLDRHFCFHLCLYHGYHPPPVQRVPFGHSRWSGWSVGRWPFICSAKIKSVKIYLPFPYVFVIGCIIRHKNNITFTYFSTVPLRMLSEMWFGPSPSVHIVKTWSGCEHCPWWEMTTYLKPFHFALDNHSMYLILNLAVFLVLKYCILSKTCYFCYFSWLICDQKIKWVDWRVIEVQL